MWTSVNMEAYLAVTNSENHTPCLSALGVEHFPQQHTAEKYCPRKKEPMEEWARAEKVTRGQRRSCKLPLNESESSKSGTRFAKRIL